MRCIIPSLNKGFLMSIGEKIRNFFKTGNHKWILNEKVIQALEISEENEIRVIRSTGNN